MATLQISPTRCQDKGFSLEGRACLSRQDSIDHRPISSNRFALSFPLSLLITQSQHISLSSHSTSLKCGGARGGRCLITHEHQQLKWSSENDVNL